MKKCDVGLLLIRLGLAAVFVVHGLEKIFPQLLPGGPTGGIANFTKYLGEKQIPYPVAAAWVVALWELIGGAFVGLGIFARIAALGLLAEMLVAIGKVHLRNGFFLPGGYEYPMALGVMALAIVIAGPGKYAAPIVSVKKQKK